MQPGEVFTAEWRMNRAAWRSQYFNQSLNRKWMLVWLSHLSVRNVNSYWLLEHKAYMCLSLISVNK